MRRIFIDTSFHIATFSSDDDLHRRALAVSDELSRDSGNLFITAEPVLVEFLTYVSRGGAANRLRASEYVGGLRSDPRVVLVEQTSDHFERGLDLYRARPDKSYSMTDCMSMVICRAQDITDVLTHEADLAQEGFTALLRETT